MSSPVHPSGPRPVPVAAARRPAPKKRSRWGWLEWFLVAQAFIPGLLFVPGVSPVRVLIRVAVFIMAIVTWVAIVQSGRRRAGEDRFKAGACVKLVIGWLLVPAF